MWARPAGRRVLTCITSSASTTSRRIPKASPCRMASRSRVRNAQRSWTRSHPRSRSSRSPKPCRVASSPRATDGALRRAAASPFMRRELYVGVMSGTSMDGIDAVLVDFGPMHAAQGCKVLAATARPLDPGLRSELMLLQQPVDDELARAARAANALADAYAAVISEVLSRAGVAADDVEAAG